MSLVLETIQNTSVIVIKIGSALLTNTKDGTVRENWLETLAADIKTLTNQGQKVVLVTSGAIALGRRTMNISNTARPSSIPLDQKQAAAAVGQIHIAKAYEEAFSEQGLQSALILLTPRDTEERRTHLNARNNIHALLREGIVPIINENDTVSTDEIRFGDNDRLAARAAQMISADLLIQLSTTDGLYSTDPKQDKNAQHIPVVETITDKLINMAGEAQAGLSTGGMKSKLMAAQIATDAGIPMIIADGTRPSPINALINEPDARSTFFKPSAKLKTARKKWISSHLKPKGSITIDAGALKALQSGKSLLPAGIVSISGTFDLGDPVHILDKNNHKIAIGLAGYNADEAQLIIGKQSEEIADLLGYARGKAFIHRNDLVLSE
ncbi:MAG: glutamate 5-kinase [Alphaproteobacteria bacterium]|nr:glutamate 5-kinase [Alphaproteobacteria bacterium]